MRSLRVDPEALVARAREIEEVVDHLSTVVGKQPFVSTPLHDSSNAAAQHADLTADLQFLRCSISGRARGLTESLKQTASAYQEADRSLAVDVIGRIHHA